MVAVKSKLRMRDSLSTTVLEFEILIKIGAKFDMPCLVAVKSKLRMRDSLSTTILEFEILIKIGAKFEQMAATLSSKGVHKIALAWKSMYIAAFFTIPRAEARGAILVILVAASREMVERSSRPSSSTSRITLDP